MRNLISKLYVKAQILRQEHGQDLVEYALIAALIAVACVASMQGVATALNNEYAKVSGALT
jgi:pilus assembly protein Flp/PilA